MTKTVRRRKAPFEYLAINSGELSAWLNSVRTGLILDEQRLRVSPMAPLEREFEFGPVTGDNFTLKAQLQTRGRLRPRIHGVAAELAAISKLKGLRIRLIGRPTNTTLEYRVSAANEEMFRTLLLRGREARLTAELDDFFGKNKRAQRVLHDIESTLGRECTIA